MTDQKIYEIVNLLKKLTLQQKLRWSLIDPSGSSFSVKTDPYSIILRYNGLTYSLTVMNKAGIQIGSINENVFTTTMSVNVVKDLYEVVKNQTLGENLDDLLSKLKDI